MGKGWGCRQALGHLHGGGGRTFGSPSEHPMLVIDLIACLVSVLLPIWNEKVRVSSQKMIISGKSHKLISLLQHSGISSISCAH